MNGKINRNNYPVWITDYHDGNLDTQDQEELLSFLSNNPDLKDEFEQFDQLGHNPLRPELTIMPDEKDLRKEFNDLTFNQQEELTAALAEGDITGVAAEETMHHINASPYLSDLYNILKITRLKPDNVIFIPKKSLKHYPLMLRFKKTTVLLLATAASIAILFSLSLLFNREKPLSAPLTDLTEIDPVVNIGVERSAGETVAKNLIAKTENVETENVETENVETEKREASSSRNTSNSSKTITAETLITGSETYVSTTREIQSQRDIEAERENPNLNPIKHIATPRLIGEATSSARLAEMASLDITNNDNYDSPRELIAKNFRKVMLGEVNATNDRLKPIELADATVTGINKLLGWEMKLEKESDENGILNSLSFTSQLIKFDHNRKASNK